MWATTALVAAVAGLAGGELARLSGAVGAPLPPVFVGGASVVIALATSSSAGPTDTGSILVVSLALVLAAGALSLSLGPPSPARLTAAAVLVMAPLYVGLPLGLLSWLRATSGPGVTIWLLAVIALSDSAQYFVGRAFGRRKLAPAVSPAKTVEGAAGGLVAVAAFGIFTAGSVLGLSPASGAFLALLLGLAGILGDLFESMLKRSAGVKDSSALIPGHGGILDRIDSHLFSAPVFYLFARYFW